MDAFVLARLATALARDWEGAWLQGVWEDLAGRLLLKLRQRGRNGLLLLGKEGIGLVPRRPPCPPRPTALAAYLRAHGAGTLRAVHTVAGQRIVELELGSPDASCRLVLEALPRGARLVVVDGAGVVRAEAGNGGARAAGSPYRPPDLPQDRPLPAAVTAGELRGWCAQGEPLPRRVLGLGAELAREVVHRAAAGESWRAWQQVLGECLDSTSLWQYREYLSAARLSHLPERGAERDDVLVAAGDWLLATADAAQQQAAAAAKAKAAADLPRRVERRLIKIRADLAALPDPALPRAQAEALAAVLWQVQRGQRAVQVADLREPERKYELVLKPALSPGENLNRLYLQARKLERTRQALGRRLAESEAELAAGAPVFPAQPPRGKGRAEPPAPYRRFRSSDGWSIRVGRNGVENDRLVREAKPWDLWFHVRAAAGAHVVVRKPGRESRVPDRTLTEAAGLAARFSNRSGDSAVDVQFTEIARLRKPKGASPGQVLVADDRTLRVPPGAGHPTPL